MGSFSIASPFQAPNVAIRPVYQANEIFFAQPEQALKQGVQLAAGYPYVLPGDVLGRITATGKFRRYTATVLNANVSIGGTSFVAKDPTTGAIVEPPFIPGETVHIGSEDLVVASVVDSTGTVNLASAFTAAHVAGVGVVLTTPDGSEKAVGISGSLRAPSMWRHDKPDVNNLLDIDYLTEIILAGTLYKSKLRGVDPAAVTALAMRDLSPAFDAWRF